MVLALLLDLFTGAFSGVGGTPLLRWLGTLVTLAGQSDYVGVVPLLRWQGTLVTVARQSDYVGGTLLLRLRQISSCRC